MEWREGGRKRGRVGEIKGGAQIVTYRDERKITTTRERKGRYKERESNLRGLEGRAGRERKETER